VWPELRRVAVPMLFIRGVSSDTFTAAAADRVKRELPHATVLELGETSHFLPMERAKEVASKIIDWHRGLGV
jgi:pimeloyl-ACP methyl ester carboxylesterase